MIYIILYTFTCTFSLEKNVILHISSYFLAHAITLKIFHSNKTLIITLAFQETNTLNISES